jgi:ribonuclease HII
LRIVIQQLTFKFIHCIVINEGHRYLGLDDSKKVTASKRQILNKKLKDGVLEYAYGLV